MTQTTEDKLHVYYMNLLHGARRFTSLNDIAAGGRVMMYIDYPIPHCVGTVLSIDAFSKFVYVEWDTENTYYAVIYNYRLLCSVPPEMEGIIIEMCSHPERWEMLRAASAKLGYVRRKYPELYGGLDVPDALDRLVPDVDTDVVTNISCFM